MLLSWQNAITENIQQPILTPLCKTNHNAAQKVLTLIFLACFLLFIDQTLKTKNDENSIQYFNSRRAYGKHNC